MEIAHRPNLFVAGFPKCGTTTLCHYLGSHPDVFLCNPKEPHYFSIGAPGLRFSSPGALSDLAGLPCDIDAYETLYAGRKEQWLCDGSTTYVLSPGAPAAIRKYNPEARIIIMIRNPVDRAFSAYSHMRKLNRENESFTRGIDLEAERTKANYSYMWRYMNGSLYHERIQAFCKAFGRESVYIGVFESFIKDTEAFLKDVCSFLGLPGTYAFELGKIKNESRLMRDNIQTRLMKSESAPMRTIKSLVPANLKKWFIRRNSYRLELDSDTRATQMKRFEDDLMALERDFGVNLDSMRT